MTFHKLCISYKLRAGIIEQEGSVNGFCYKRELLSLNGDSVKRILHKLSQLVSRLFSKFLADSMDMCLFSGQTDIVCVIGMVKVQIVGSVQTGERIYASTDNPGTGVPESHLPLGAFMVRNHTLLGMAMETCKSRYHDEVNLVKSFVCIVLGINSRQLSNEVENIMENIDMDIKVAIGKSNKRTCRRKSCLCLGRKNNNKTLSRRNFVA